MSRIDPVSPASFEYDIAGDQGPLVQDVDLIGKLVNVDNPSGANGNDVMIAADRDETVMVNAALQLDKRLKLRMSAAAKPGSTSFTRKQSPHDTGSR